MSEEIEIDARLAFSQSINLRTVAGTVFDARLDIFETVQPYVLVFTVTTKHDHSLRMDIHKSDLSNELRRWLDGPRLNVLHPALIPSKRLDDSMMQFIKFGNPPKQEVLFRWILTRTEIKWGNDAEMAFGGLTLSSQFDSSQKLFHYDENEKQNEYNNELKQTVKAATESKGGFRSIRMDLRDDSYLNNSGFTQSSSQKDLKYSNMVKTVEVDTSSYTLTKKLLGRSQALDILKRTRSSSVSKLRDGAKSSASVLKMTSSEFILGCDIEKTRKIIEDAMELRRRTIEIAKVRQKQIASKYEAIKAEIKENKQTDTWNAIAFEELVNLRKTKDEIDRDIVKQRIKAQRAQQLLMWTKAPPGFSNYRGKSKPGYPIGEGPLPFSATTNLKNPEVERTMKKFYWDSYGRRHVKDPGDQDYDEKEKSLVDQAFDAIRAASQNAAAYKLDLKGIFMSFDTSGDGKLSRSEMSKAFHALGVPLDPITADILFKHFDPNGNGSVHYGEFEWAFFNRRAMARKYRRHTSGLTNAQILEKFHKFDINGDGSLTKKEFNRLLQSFQISLNDRELEILIQRFYRDGDGRINIHEFKDFIDQEVNRLDSTEASRSSMHNVLPSRPSSAPLSSSKRSQESSYAGRSQLFSRNSSYSNSRTVDSSVEEATAAMLHEILEAQAKLESKLGTEYFYS